MTTAVLAQQSRQRARWTDLAAFGFVMAAAGPVLYLIAALIFGLGDDTGFFLITVAVPLIVALLVRRFGTWSKAVGIVIGLFGGMSMFWTAFGIFQPKSFFDFVPSLLFVPGLLIGVGSCIAAIVAKRRGHLGVSAVGNERRTIRVVTTVVAIAAVLSGATTVIARTSVADTSDATATSKMDDFKFSPKAISAAGGTKILVRNEDPFVHTFTVKALGVDVTLSPRSTKLVFIPARAGTYLLICKLHVSSQDKPSKDDMAGTLVVT